jgi:hypothetical protein
LYAERLAFLMLAHAVSVADDIDVGDQVHIGVRRRIYRSHAEGIDDIIASIVLYFQSRPSICTPSLSMERTM